MRNVSTPSMKRADWSGRIKVLGEEGTRVKRIVLTRAPNFVDHFLASALEVEGVAKSHPS